MVSKEDTSSPCTIFTLSSSSLTVGQHRYILLRETANLNLGELFWDQRDKIKRNFDMELNIRIPKGIGFLGEWGEGKWVNMKKEEIRYRQPLPRAICNAEHSEPAILERKGFVGI